MILRPVVEIRITQNSTPTYINRNDTFELNFVSEGEINRNVSQMVQCGYIVFPKKVNIKKFNNLSDRDNPSDGDINQQPISITSENISPLIQRGDSITIRLGYYNDDRTKILAYYAFTGFITKIDIKSPLKIDFEDFMYILKQINCPNISYDTALPGYSLEKLINLVLNGGDYTDPSTNKTTQYPAPVWNPSNSRFEELPLSDIYNVKLDNYSTNIGKWTLYSTATIAQFLDEIKSKYKFSIFLTDNFVDTDSLLKANNKKRTLNIGLIKYYTDGNLPTNHDFHFQKNIIADAMTYNRIDDVKVKLVGYGIIKQVTDTGETKKNGTLKTKLKRIEGTYGDPNGETRTMYFPPKNADVTTTNYDIYYNKGDEVTKKSPHSKILDAQIKAVYPKLKYEGFKGSFTTFGYPRILPGDVVTFYDQIITERNKKTYFVKGVKTTFGSNGIHQEIEIDYKFDFTSVTSDQLKNGY